MATENTSNSASKEKKKKSGLLGAGLPALGAGVAAFTSVYLMPPSAPTTEIACTSKEIVAEGQASDFSDIAYVELRDVLITIGSSPSDRYLKANFTIMTSKGNEKKIEQARPQLLDAFNVYLRAVEVEQLEDPAFFAYLRAQLSRRADLILGPNQSKGVLITDFLLR